VQLAREAQKRGLCRVCSILSDSGEEFRYSSRVKSRGILEVGIGLLYQCPRGRMDPWVDTRARVCLLQD
jgi:hypothetical protein